MIRQNYSGWFFLFFPFLPVLTFADLLESEFNHVNHLIVSIHAPLVYNHLNSKIRLIEVFDGFGGAFKVDSALKPVGESSFVVTLTGAVPQSAPMNMDGYAIVACHELGHILGGTPKQTSALAQWSSVEGQADYYATNQCMWHYVKNLQSSDVIHDFDKESVARCDEVFGDDINKMLGCLRITSGILAMVDYFNQTISKDNNISLTSHDETKVTKTLQKYPSPQCRVDTWLAGLYNQPRPRCWFNG